MSGPPPVNGPPGGAPTTPATTETQDFTPWLAREENLAILGETTFIWASC